MIRKGKVYASHELHPAEEFPPGDYIREELKARGWTQRQFAAILGRPQQFISGIINATRSITPRTAAELGEALGTSAQLWLNLESSWQLSRISRPDPAIRRRARQAAA
jgi:HTH-type transcriptional regulator / antitoxin HigA